MIHANVFSLSSSPSSLWGGNGSLCSRRQLNRILFTHSLIYKMIRNRAMIADNAAAAADAAVALAAVVAANVSSSFYHKELKTHKLSLLFNQQYILIHDIFVYARSLSLISSICIVASTADQNSNLPSPHTHIRSHQHCPSSRLTTQSVNKNKNNIAWRSVQKNSKYKYKYNTNQSVILFYSICYSFSCCPHCFDCVESICTGKRREKKRRRKNQDIINNTVNVCVFARVCSALCCEFCWIVCSVHIHIQWASLSIGCWVTFVKLLSNRLGFDYLFNFLSLSFSFALIERTHARMEFRLHTHALTDFVYPFLNGLNV